MIPPVRRTRMKDTYGRQWRKKKLRTKRGGRINDGGQARKEAEVGRHRKDESICSISLHENCGMFGGWGRQQTAF